MSSEFASPSRGATGTNRGHGRSAASSQRPNTTTKVSWTRAEDEKLIRLVEQARGQVSWSSLAVSMEERTSKQCRERWYNHLDPSIIHGPFTDIEKDLVAEGFRRWNTSWARIKRELLPHRSENAIKNYYNTTMRPRVISGTSTNTSSTSLVPQTLQARNEHDYNDTSRVDMGLVDPPHAPQRSGELDRERELVRDGASTSTRSLEPSEKMHLDTSIIHGDTPSDREPKRIRISDSEQDSDGAPARQQQHTVPVRLKDLDITTNTLYRNDDYEMVERKEE